MSRYHGTRPPYVTRVGRYLLFPGGRVTRLSRWQQLLFATGLKTSTTNHERSARL